MKKMFSIKIRKKIGENETKTGTLEGIMKTWSLQAKLGDVTGLVWLKAGQL